MTEYEPWWIETRELSLPLTPCEQVYEHLPARTEKTDAYIAAIVSGLASVASRLEEAPSDEWGDPSCEDTTLAELVIRGAVLCAGLAGRFEPGEDDTEIRRLLGRSEGAGRAGRATKVESGAAEVETLLRRLAALLCDADPLTGREWSRDQRKRIGVGVKAARALQDDLATVELLDLVCERTLAALEGE